MNLFVANLHPDTNAEALRVLFSEFGEIVSYKVIFDPTTGASRGFGFVEMADKMKGFDAIDNLDQTFFEGNIISVKEAKQNNQKGGGGRSFNKPRGPREGGYNSGGGGFKREGGGFNRDRGGFSREGGGGSYNRDRGGYNRDNTGGYNRDNGGGYNRDNTGGYNRDNTGGYNRDSSYNREQRDGGYNRDRNYKKDEDFNKL